MEEIKAFNIMGELINAVCKDLAPFRVDGKRKIEEAIEILLSIKGNLEREREVNATAIHLGVSKVKDCLSQLSSQHWSIHKKLSQFNKKIELNFQKDCGMSIFEPMQSDAEKLLDQVICNHLLRNGFVETAVEFSKESGQEIDNNTKQTFESLKEIQAKLKERNLDAAIVWAQTHHDKLLEMNSSLEFKLHQQKFIQILSQGGRQSQIEAIAYARKYFTLFTDRHNAEIAKVMGILVYVNRDQESPYKHFFDPVRWIEINDLFNKAAASVLGFSIECPLSTCIDVGAMALLTLDSLQKSRTLISSDNEISVDVDTGGRVYHSTFNCPILKQQSSLSNPPVRLPCGHAISLEAIQQLRAYMSRGIGTGKCPYCPVNFQNSRITELHF